ncbi:hypothetical protein [Microbacterium sp. JZ31]|uniref:hypothetical protein n=1 Tax=Microbacterium sp. JZ31 TaxID=1906274 RepID=UPI001933E2AB|nr:hypothetical protein [Microbacterium sp. JZ31]
MTEFRWVMMALVWSLLILFGASVILLVVQVATGTADLDNWFSRIMVSGLGAVLTAAVLWRLVERRRLSMLVKGLASLIGAGVAGALLFLAASAIWP